MIGRSNRLLFIDPNVITRSRDVRIAVNPPASEQIVMRVDRPWEGRFIAFYLSVMEDQGKLRMWYTCRDKAGRGFLAYAESFDGVEWVKPDLGIVEYEGNSANNLVGIADLEGNVFIDPHAPDARRYNYVTTVFKEGIYLYTSPDGLHWRRNETPFLPFVADSQIITFPDETSRGYRIYLRGWRRTDAASTAERERTVVYAETNDLTVSAEAKPSENSVYLWKESPHPAITTELPEVFRCDERDEADVYTMAAIPYPPDPSYYVAFPALYRHFSEGPGKVVNDGRTEVHFIGGVDGTNWFRYDRTPYWKPGLRGTDHSEMTFIGYGMLSRGKEMWQYGTGYRTTHGDNERRIRESDGVIVLLKQRIDGFVSADTDYRGGEFTTVGVVCSGKKLSVNADAGVTGFARVGLLNESGEPIAGFEVAACDPLRGNDTAFTVQWNGNPDMTSLLGRTVQLVVHSQSCKLYSMRFEE